jgi:hypothetical protein
LQDSKGKVVIEPLYRKIIGPLQNIFGGRNDDEHFLSIMILSYILSLSLLDIVEFLGITLQESPYEIVDALGK